MHTITTSTGKVIEITYTKDYIPGTPQFRVAVDGEVTAKGATIGIYGRAIEVRGKTIIGSIDLRDDTAIGLTREDVAALHADAAANRTVENSDRLAMNHLRDLRSRLLTDRDGAIADANPDDLYESEHEHINLQRRAAADEAASRIPAADAALAAFDAEHPEVLEAIRRESDAKVERNRWN